MLKWGLAGCGDIANKRVAPAILDQPDSAIAAAASPYKGELDTFLNRFGIKKGYDDIDIMLEKEDIDIVYAAVPVYLHYETAMKALRSGRHVLVEKPMGMDTQQCASLVNEAESRGLKLGVAYFRRFFPKVAEAKRMIAEGIIGVVIGAEIKYQSWYRPEPSAWRVQKNRSGGGPLWDMGCHKLDMLIDMLGMPSSVFAVMKTLTHGYDVEDSCIVVMEMKNGAQCAMILNWNSRVWADTFEITGTEGKIIFDPCDSESMTVRRNPRITKGPGREDTTVSRPNSTNVHYPLIDDFAGSVLEDRQPAVSGREGYKTNLLLDAIERSSADGIKIFI